MYGDTNWCAINSASQHLTLFFIEATRTLLACCSCFPLTFHSLDLGPALTIARQLSPAQPCNPQPCCWIFPDRDQIICNGANGDHSENRSLFGNSLHTVCVWFKSEVAVRDNADCCVSGQCSSVFVKEGNDGTTVRIMEMCEVHFVF